MLSCSRLNCSNKPSYECTCRNERKYYCQNDLQTHVNDQSTTHTIKALGFNPDPEVIKEVVNSLVGVKNEVKKHKKAIIDDFSRLMSQFEERGRILCRNMGDYEKSIEKAINDVKTNPGSIPECNLKKTLVLSLEEAKKECEKWKLLSVDLNSLEMNSSISKWATVVSDIEYLFTDKKELSSMLQKSSSSEYPSFIPQKESLFDRPASVSISNSPTKSQGQFNSPNVANSPQIPNKAPIGRSNTIGCRNNHELKWTVTVPFKYYRKNKNFWINCGNCQRKFSSSCWHCEICDYDLCDGCGLNKGLPSQKMKCDNNHELLWRPDADMFYESKGQEHKFRCRSCNLFKDEAHWHCRSCEYDICQNCGINKGQSSLCGSTKCSNNHQLSHSIARAVNLGGLVLAPKCNCCGVNFSGNAYTCEQCSYYLCPDCYGFYNNPTAGHPVFRCQASHLLRWVQRAQFQCDYCFEKKNQERYKCKECNFDVCMTCSDVLLNIVIKGEQKSHGPNNHPLTWVANISQRNGGNPIACNACGLNYRKAGMFCCNTCSNNYCLLCYNDPNRPKPQPQSLAGLGGNNPLASLLLLNQLLGGLPNRNN